MSTQNGRGERTRRMARIRVWFGHEYAWYKEKGWWENTSDSTIRVIPPTTSRRCWLVFLPGTSVPTEFWCSHGEERVFSFASDVLTNPIVRLPKDDLSCDWSEDPD